MGDRAAWGRLEKDLEFRRTLIDGLFIDECLSIALVAAAKQRGLPAVYRPYVGKQGWSDHGIIQFAVENDLAVVTNNRRDFLKGYAKLSLHNGLLIIVPNVARSEQIHLFNLGLDAALERHGNVVDTLIEVLATGAVHVREWTAAQGDLLHIDKPAW